MNVLYQNYHELLANKVDKKIPREECLSTYEPLIEKYLKQSESDKAFPEKMIDSILMKKNLKTLQLEDFEDLYIFTREILEKFYIHYRKTKSFKFLEKNLKKNDKINNRLYLFRIVNYRI